MNRVLFVDDDDDLRDATQQSLTLAGFTVDAVGSAAAALKLVEAGFDGVVVTDIRMPEMDGLELLRRLIARDADLPVILISGHADVATAVGALRQGAYDVLAKPYPPDQLIASIERALERRRLVIENRRLRGDQSAAGTGPLLGQSPAIEHLRRTIAQIAEASVDVLIEGETGTGKGVVAQMLHALSRRPRAMVTVDCGALPDALVESELFGHVSGAFAGAQHPRTGRIEQADRGTLFLDEIDAMRADVQLKLQRVLETREVTPLGSNLARAIDVRVISASKADLGQLVQQEAFRASLYYRVNGVTLRIPPLRERREDIVPLFRAFVSRAAERLGQELPMLNAAVWRRLDDHDWPGNVRELMRFAENVALGIADDVADSPGAGSDVSLKTRVGRFEADLIEEALGAANGDGAAAIEALGLPRQTFYDKVARYAIDLARFRDVSSGRKARR